MTREAFKALFDAHFEEIRIHLYYRSGDESLATDIAQDCFMKVWDRKMDLEPGKDRPLLYKMAGDLVKSHFRREKRGAEIRQTLHFEYTSGSSEEDLEYKELQQAYERALSNLPEKQRVVFLMSRTEELSYLEIADRLSLSIKAVEKRMSGALSRLRKELKHP